MLSSEPRESAQDVDTDYAFDGTKQMYTEADSTNPLSWYATTKSEGAKRVLGLGDKGLVIRISNPYRAHQVGKKDFVHKMLERLLAGSEVVAPYQFCYGYLSCGRKPGSVSV